LEDKGTGVHNKMQLRTVDATGLFYLPVLSLHLELELLIQTGLTNKETIQAATIVTARFMEVDQKTSHIMVGYDTDLIL